MATLDHSARKHALLSASGASRWLNCTPSARLEDKFPNKSSVYAEEGTLAHELSEIEIGYALGLIPDKVYSAELRKIRKHKLYTDEHEVEVGKYVDIVLETYNAIRNEHPDAVIKIEQRLDFSHIVEFGFGTGDILIIADGKIYVIDLKYGKGVPVSAENNSQLKLYGVGALREYELLYDIHTVVLMIVQPRIDNFSTWEISVKDLIDWALEVVKPKAKQAYIGEGDQKVGDWCRFCRAKPICRSYAEYNQQIARHEFKDPEILDDDEVADILKRVDVLNEWAKSVKEYALERALKGKKWPGFKIVEGRSQRRFLDEKAVADKLKILGFKRSDYMVTKLKNLTAIESLVGKKEFSIALNTQILKPEGAPALVDESDSRPAKGLEQAKQDFGDPID